MSKQTKHVSSRRRKRKRLFFDIETSPNIGFFWRTGYKLNIGHHNIIKERAIICIAYKWAGQKTVHCLQWDASQNDKKMLKAFIEVFNRADEVVSHNGNRFDIKWVRTRCIKHGLDMMPNPISIDTLQSAKALFLFNSNALNYIAKFLGLGQKLSHEGFDMWKDIVLKKDKRAMATMVRYCKHDVVLLEQVWDKMNSYVKPRTSVAQTTRECPECGSGSVHVKMYRSSPSGYETVQFKCQDCRKHHTISRSRFEKGNAL